MDEKWPDASPRHRKSTAEGLATLTCGLIDDVGRPPDLKALREALRVIALKLDGTRVAPATFTRKGAALSGVVNFAVEKGYLANNLLVGVRTPTRAPSNAVDPRVVVNPDHAKALLDAVREIEPALHAFFTFLYYAGARPAEVRNVRLGDLELPKRGWRNVVLSGGYEESGRAWTDAGTRGEERGLKHRGETDTRPVPLHPNLVMALQSHLDGFGTGVSGRLFVTRTARGGRPLAAPFQNPVSMSTVYRVWDLAREKALTPGQDASSLARRPYDLRHACLTTWLNAGVDTTLVARWAGHSVTVLLKVYAGCLDDRDALAKARIEELVPSV